MEQDYKVINVSKVLSELLAWKEFCKLNPSINNEFYVTEDSFIGNLASSSDIIARSETFDKNLCSSEETAECMLTQ